MNQEDILNQHRRENPEPHEGATPIPWTVIGLVGVLVLFGIVYIATFARSTPSEWGDERTREELVGNHGGSAAAQDGAAIYAAVCSACHQAAGQGLSGAFPPLAESEWVNGDERRLAAIVLNGVEGKLTVKGQSYQGSMPSFKKQLDDAKLAAVLTFVRSRWGNTGAPVAADTIAQVRLTHQSRDKPFGGEAELAKE